MNLSIKAKSKEELEISTLCRTAKTFKTLAERVADKMLHHFTRLEFKEKPPQLYTTYQQFNEKERLNYNNKCPNWLEESGTKEWLDKRDHINNTNMSNILFLESILPKLDEDRKGKVLDKIKLIKGTSHANTGVNQALKTFNGTVEEWT